MGIRYKADINLFWDGNWFKAIFHTPQRRSIEAHKLERDISHWLYTSGKGDWCFDKSNDLLFFTNSEEDAVYLKLKGGTVIPHKNHLIHERRRVLNFVPSVYTGSNICDLCYTKTIYIKDDYCLNCIELL